MNDVWAGRSRRLAQTATTAMVIAGVLFATSAPARAATPTLVQHVAAPSGASFATTGINMQLPNASLQGNLLLLCVTWATTGGVTLPQSGVSDDRGQSWKLAVTASGASGQTAALFYAPNTAAGVKRIAATFSGGRPTFVSGLASEWYNVSPSPTVRSGTADSAGATPSWATSSFTPDSGDLVYQCAAGNGQGGDAGAFTAQSGFTLGSAQRTQAAQVAQYGTGTGSTMTPTVTVGAVSLGYTSVAGSFTSAAAGTVPTATPRIVHIQHNQLGPFDASPIADQFPSSGNLLVIMASCNSFAGAVTIAPTDGNRNSYIQISGSPLVNSAGGQIQGFYAKSATTGPTMTTSIAYTVTSLSGANVVYYDVTGADPNPFVASNTATGVQSSPGNLTSVTIPASGSFGQSGLLVLAHIDHNTGNETGTAPDSNGHTPLFTMPWMSNDDGNFAGEFTLDSGEAAILTADVSAVTFVWTRSATQAQEWESFAMAFKGASASSAAPVAPSNLQLR